MIAIACRVASSQDEPFIRNLILHSLAGELGTSAWPATLRDQVLGTQYSAKRASHRASFPNAEDLIVRAAGEDCGWLISAILPDELRLIDIVISPERRARGIGSEVLGQLIERAQALHVPLTLHVNTTNPGAIRLYSRLGFHRIAGDELRYFMRRSCSSSE